MKNIFLLLTCAISFACSNHTWAEQENVSAQQTHANAELIKEFLAELPEGSFLRTTFERGSCSHCGDVAVAVYLLKSEDDHRRKIGRDIFYNALLIVFSHGQLKPEEVLTEMQNAEKAISKL